MDNSTAVLMVIGELRDIAEEKDKEVKALTATIEELIAENKKLVEQLERMKNTTEPRRQVIPNVVEDISERIKNTRDTLAGITG